MSNLSSSTESLILISGLSKAFRLAERDIPVLSHLDLEIREGEFVAIMGASGSGKSTLLHLLGCLERPSTGCYRLAGRSVDELDDSELSRLRAEEFGFVFQKFYLLPQLSVYENVRYPFLFSPGPPENVPARIHEVLSQVGLSHRARHRPSELSGGEMQRVAIARALVTRPRLILADEPTGNLDAATAREILRLLLEINQNGTTLVLVTHDPQVAAQAERSLVLREGRFEH